MATAHAAPGQTIGRFVLESTLGSGGMGVVFAARDPVLDRTVALKLIHPGAGSSGGVEARLLREAQALARLTHPNVVTVHEAGVVGGTVFLAMELVDGVTLRDWMTTRRSWREIAEVFTAAGTGLAAAHAAGMIHRDFKPANVLIDRSGRVKVGDFGLVGVAREARDASAPDTAPRPPTPGSVLASPLTQDGAVMGTPAYMAPEQLAGATVDARADQYAFCKSLREALATATDTVPPRLTAIVDRGTADDATARFPTMAAVLAAITGVVHGRRRRVMIAAIGGGVVAAAAIAVIATWGVVGGNGGGDPCANAAAPVAATWNPARRDAVRAHLATVDPTSGAVRFTTVAAALDAHAGRLGTMRRDACRANRVTHVESDTLYDRRIACLDHRGSELATAIDALLATTDLVGVDTATTATQNLSADACTNAAALLAAQPPPSDPAVRGEVAAIEAAIAEVTAARTAGNVDGLDAKAAALVDRARKTGHDPILAAALRERAEVLHATSAPAAEVETLRELTEVAARAADDRAAAWAWSELLTVLVDGTRQRDQAEALIPAARAAVLRAGAAPDLAIDFRYNLASVYGQLGKFDDAQAQITEAIAMLTQQGADRPGSPLMHRLADVVARQAKLFLRAGNTAAADPLFRRAIDLWTRSEGADHPDTAGGWHSLGVSLEMQSKPDDSIAAYREAVRIRTARTGESPALAETLVALTQTLIDKKAFTDALAEVEHAIAILRARGASNQLAYALAIRGSVYAKLERYDDARRASDEAIDTYAAAPSQDTRYPMALVNRAELAMNRGELDDAERDFTRALEVFTKLVGPDYPSVIYPLVGLAYIALRHDKGDDAIAFAERALAIDPKWSAGNSGQQELARFIRAAAKKDKAGMKASRAALAAIGPMAKAELGIADDLTKRR